MNSSPDFFAPTGLSKRIADYIVEQVKDIRRQKELEQFGTRPKRKTFEPSSAYGRPSSEILELDNDTREARPRSLFSRIGQGFLRVLPIRQTDSNSSERNTDND